MSHTYTSNFIHCIFSTKNRLPNLAMDRLPELYSYFSGIARGEGFELLRAGGTSNHVHLIIALSADLALATAMQKLKGSSSRWLGKDFACQQGYGAFSVSPSQLLVVTAYIDKQAEHHRRQSFEEEFTHLLESCGVSYDPRFMFG